MRESGEKKDKISKERVASCKFLYKVYKSSSSMSHVFPFYGIGGVIMLSALCRVTWPLNAQPGQLFSRTEAKRLQKSRASRCSGRRLSVVYDSHMSAVHTCTVRISVYISSRLCSLVQSVWSRYHVQTVWHRLKITCYGPLAIHTVCKYYFICALL